MTRLFREALPHHPTNPRCCRGNQIRQYFEAYGPSRPFSGQASFWPQTPRSLILMHMFTTVNVYTYIIMYIL